MEQMEANFMEERVRRLPSTFSAPHPAAGCLLRNWGQHRLQQPSTQPLQAHQLPRGKALSISAAFRGGRACAVLPDASRYLRARP
jgi:hypothetical protein